MYDYKELLKYHNKVIIIYENTINETDLDKEEILKYDGYAEYSNNHGRINYRKYHFKEKILDSNNNLILISDVEEVFSN